MGAMAKEPAGRRDKGLSVPRSQDRTTISGSAGLHLSVQALPLFKPDLKQFMTLQTEQVEVKVRATVNSYQTGTVRGFRASCSAGPEQAARALGLKLYGTKLVSISQKQALGNVYGLTHWVIEGPVDLLAKENQQ